MRDDLSPLKMVVILVLFSLKFEEILPPEKRSHARSCRCISRGRILDQQPKSYDRQQKKEGDRRTAAMLLKVQEDKRMLEHRAAKLKKFHLREMDQCPN